MKNIENKKNLINTEFFEVPQKKFLWNLFARNFLMDNREIDSLNPCIFLCYNISTLSKKLISSAIRNKFVFINQTTSIAIMNGSLSKTKYSELLKCIEQLKENDYSIVFINGEYPSVFGDYQLLSKSTSSFLYDTNLDIKYLLFPAEYYSMPMWSENERRCKIHPIQNIAVTHRKLEGFTEDETLEYLNNLTPASANVYSVKYPLTIRDQSRASFLERIMYCCPKCSSFFSVYSEFSCIKCSSCMAAIEISSDGAILFSSQIKSFDDIEEFLFNTLTKKGFDINPIVTYENVLLKERIDEKPKLSKPAKLTIYADKFTIEQEDSKKQTFEFNDVSKIDLTFNNTLVLVTSNNKKFIISGKERDNLYIMKDLVKLNKN